MIFATFSAFTALTSTALFPVNVEVPTVTLSFVTVKFLTPEKLVAFTEVAPIFERVTFTFSTFAIVNEGNVSLKLKFAVSLSVVEPSINLSVPVASIESLSPTNVSFLVVPTKISFAVSAVNVPVPLI